MIILNLLAYRRTVRSGFYGKNFNTYLTIKKDVQLQMSIKDPSLPVVVYFERETKNTYPYLYLQSEGIILLEKEEMNFKNANYSNFILEKDLKNQFHLFKIN